MRGVAAYRAVAAESRVFGASAHDLVAILLDEAIMQIDAVAASCRKGNRPHGAHARAQSILCALDAGLDRQAGGETADLMGRVYREAQRCLRHAVDEMDPLWCEKARGVLQPIVHAWSEIAQAA